MNYRILIVDDEEEMCRSLSELLESEGMIADWTMHPSEALGKIAVTNYDMVMLDIRMPEMGGVELLQKIKSIASDLPVTMMTGYPTVQDVVLAMRYGAVNVYTKPIDLDQLLQEIGEHARQAVQAGGRVHLPQGGIVTYDAKMRKVLSLLDKAAPTDAPVLITGESGTGKELVARAIQQMSRRSDAPFIKINCAAIPDELLESELFGHEKGAFTGAIKERIGRFEMANGGTLFLDEIGDMSLKTQAKILRVIQEQEFEKVGGNKTIKTDIRIIAATHQDLDELIEDQRFREDLYYRLSVITLHLPPLRDRTDDAMMLTRYFIEQYNKVYGKNIQGVSPSVEEIIRVHTWPGNVRELKNCIERSVIFCEKPLIEPEHLAAQYTKLLQQDELESYENAFERLSRSMIEDALERSGGVKQKAADILNISRRTLYNRMKKLDMAL
ncbi:MAG: sigma-54-dependent Fis family transcriptional regulator [Spartobacteria bacterium]|nr:sigma-54-dependent Fis family transcriptional regulator [Spartobacteria bacterium]